jgi:hypothetical protein
MGFEKIMLLRVGTGVNKRWKSNAMGSISLLWSTVKQESNACFEYEGRMYAPVRVVEMKSTAYTTSCLYQ